MTWLALSSLTPLSLSVSVIWLTWLCRVCRIILSHVWYTHRDDDNFALIPFDNHIIIINWILWYLLICRFQQIGVRMQSPYANWSSKLLSTFYHLLFQYIGCRTLHVTHSMSHIVCNTQHVVHWLLYIACWTLYVTKHECDTTICNWVWLKCVSFLFRQNTSYLVTFIFLNLLFLHW